MITKQLLELDLELMYVVNTPVDCDAIADSMDIQWLSCLKFAGGYSRHPNINDILCWVLNVGYRFILESLGISRVDGNRQRK